MGVSGCRSCGAPIRWVVTERGKRIPLDRDPQPDGNIVPILVGGDWVARVLPVDTAAEYRAQGGDLYRAHFTTCEQADAWRKKRNAQLEKENQPDE